MICHWHLLSEINIKFIIDSRLSNKSSGMKKLSKKYVNANIFDVETKKNKTLIWLDCLKSSIEKFCSPMLIICQRGKLQQSSSLFLDFIFCRLPLFDNLYTKYQQKIMKDGQYLSRKNIQSYTDLSKHFLHVQWIKSLSNITFGHHWVI